MNTKKKIFYVYNRNVKINNAFMVFGFYHSLDEAKTAILLDVLDHRCNEVRYRIVEEVDSKSWLKISQLHE